MIFILLCFATARCNPGHNCPLKDMEANPFALRLSRARLWFECSGHLLSPAGMKCPSLSEQQNKSLANATLDSAASLTDARTQKYVRKFVKTYKMDFPILLDASAINGAVWAGETVPVNHLYDTQGNIVDQQFRARHAGKTADRLGRLSSRQERAGKGGASHKPPETPPHPRRRKRAGSGGMVPFLEWNFLKGHSCLLRLETARSAISRCPQLILPAPLSSTGGSSDGMLRQRGDGSTAFDDI